MSEAPILPSPLIHQSAWNMNSANFAFWGFSEVRQEDFKYHSFGGGACYPMIATVVTLYNTAGLTSLAL